MADSSTPAQLLGREGDRHAEDAAEDPVVAQDVPERAALAEQPHGRPAEGDLVLAQAEHRRGGRISTELSLAW